MGHNFSMVSSGYFALCSPNYKIPFLTLVWWRMTLIAFVAGSVNSTKALAGTALLLKSFYMSWPNSYAI